MPFSTIALPKAPALPLASEMYARQYQDQLNNVLRLYFNQLDAYVANLLAQLQTGIDETGYIQFDTTTARSSAPGKVKWNLTDGTLDVGMGFPGVTNQLGQELYFPPLYNNTGSLVEDGVVIGVSGSDPQGLTFVKFLADGSMSNIRALAVVTSDMEDGARGLATRNGYVRDLDTTGAPYGETWVEGDTLYASDTIAGGLTNNEPITPSIAFPIAICGAVHATEGFILVVASELRDPVYYGAFSDTVDQTLGAANTPQTITINTTDASSGVIIGSPTSRVICTHPGLYNFQHSIQFESNNASLKNIVIWCRVNGVDVPNSASDISISGSGTQLIAAWNFVLPMSANDYFELVWACSNTNVQMAATPAQTSPYVRPAIPSLILTVTQVNQ